MKTKVCVFLFVFTFIPFLVFAQETLTITTYYPSPYGSYNQLSVASNTYLAYSSGSVGIGTTGPGAKLEVTDSGDTTIRIKPASGANNRVSNYDFWGTFYNYPADTGVRRVANIQAGFATGVWGTEYIAFGLGSNDAAALPAERMRITGSGNVGIGTAGPGAKLEVAGAVKLSGVSTDPGDRTALFMNDTVSPYTGYLAGYTLGFNTGANSARTTRMYIDNSGNVGIGTVTPGKTLDVNGDIVLGSSSGNKQIYTWTSTDSNWRIGMSASPGFTRSLATSHVEYLTCASGGGQGFAIGDNVSGLSAFEVTGSGSGYNAFFRGSVGIGINPSAYKFQVYIDASNEGHVDSTGAWARSSDIRVKKNVSDLQDGLSKIMKLRAIRYDSKTDLKAKGPGKHLGFIGQEMEKVIPELVSTDNRGYKSIAYGDLTIVLTKAVQEQQKEIEEQAQANASMRKELDEIKAFLRKRSL
jgi:hypothetical protein